MHFELVNFLTDHSNLICIPLGMFIRWLKLRYDKRRHKGDKSSEALIDKTYVHMKELRERGDKSIRAHTTLLVRHNSLKDKHRVLQSKVTTLEDIVTEKDRRIRELEQQYELMKEATNMPVAQTDIGNE